MDMKAVLDRIEAWIAERNNAGERVSISSLSREATGSPDTIRNWIRARDSGRRIGGTALKVEQIAKAMGVSQHWLITGDGVVPSGRSEDLDAEIVACLVLLTEQEKELLLAAAQGFAARHRPEG
ncbi:hypothetical protein EBL87_16260 [Cereibacter sphaeroides]|uniref:hypothetical protein n=1 Tax=Cereibacter TaxID=1653176 RepID=UPI000C6EA62E|nr:MULTISPECIES: hypothetical protein [Cereibacter]AZB65315.1 hypothetical protein EBL87_16260 [Cereibacter sphaeroides]AZB70154.1 hypothetical protein EBL86_17285 [Cereibacter sphaeroides]RAZ84422.1 hypothetical protein DDV93_11750 [Cereibacter johrii]